MPIFRDFILDDIAGSMGVKDQARVILEVLYRFKIKNTSPTLGYIGIFYSQSQTEEPTRQQLVIEALKEGLKVLEAKGGEWVCLSAATKFFPITTGGHLDDDSIDTVIDQLTTIAEFNGTILGWKNRHSTNENPYAIEGGVTQRFTQKCLSRLKGESSGDPIDGNQILRGLPLKHRKPNTAAHFKHRKQGAVSREVVDNGSVASRHHKK